LEKDIAKKTSEIGKISSWFQRFQDSTFGKKTRKTMNLLESRFLLGKLGERSGKYKTKRFVWEFLGHSTP